MWAAGGGRQESGRKRGDCSGLWLGQGGMGLGTLPSTWLAGHAWVGQGKKPSPEGHMYCQTNCTTDQNLGLEGQNKEDPSSGCPGSRNNSHKTQASVRTQS